MVAVVTGGGRGIGREIALQQAREGAMVAVLARTGTEIDETVALIEGEGGRAIALPADVTYQTEVDKAFARISAELGPVDTLVNNHGSFSAYGPVWDCDPLVWWRDVEINLRGTFHTCRAASSTMLERGRGRNREERLEHIWSTTVDDYRGYAGDRWPKAVQGQRTVMLYDGKEGALLKLLDTLSDDEIAAKLPVQLRHLPSPLVA